MTCFCAFVNQLFLGISTTLGVLRRCSEFKINVGESFLRSAAFLPYFKSTYGICNQ